MRIGVRLAKPVRNLRNQRLFLHIKEWVDYITLSSATMDRFLGRVIRTLQ